MGREVAKNAGEVSRQPSAKQDVPTVSRLDTLDGAWRRPNDMNRLDLLRGDQFREEVRALFSSGQRLVFVRATDDDVRQANRRWIRWELAIHQFLRDER